MPFLFWMVLPLALMDAFALSRGAEEKPGETWSGERRNA